MPVASKSAGLKETGFPADAAARSSTAFVSSIATQPREWAKSMEMRPHPAATVPKVYHKVYQNQPGSELTLTISTG
jgi:hypothetical protein